MPRNNRKKGDLQQMRESWAKFVEEYVAMHETLVKLKETVDNHYSELTKSTARLWKAYFALLVLFGIILEEILRQ